MIDVRELMETPDGSDEVGTPNEQIAECNDCGTLHRRGSWHLCDGDRVEPDGSSGAVVADGGHDLPAGWIRIYDGVQKLQRRDGSLEIQMTDHCVGIDGDDVVRQGWQVDDPAAVGVRLAARLEASLPPADTGTERVLADGGTRVDPYPQDVIEAELLELERARTTTVPVDVEGGDE
jgi:hypothetical protein